jgi:hypothetical protein
VLVLKLYANTRCFNQLRHLAKQQLIQLKNDIQSGKREGSVITISSMKAAQGGDENIWREISRDLEDAGVTHDMISEHRGFITTWVINALILVS